jgi:hypothetical protein
MRGHYEAVALDGQHAFQERSAQQRANYSKLPPSDLMWSQVACPLLALHGHYIVLRDLHPSLRLDMTPTRAHQAPSEKVAVSKFSLPARHDPRSTRSLASLTIGLANLTWRLIDQTLAFLA